MTSLSPAVEPLEPDSEPLIELPLPSDPRWVCWQCGSLGLLGDDGLCRHCWSESVTGFAELCARAVGGGSGEVERRWRIG
jgi:hypothetical protein